MTITTYATNKVAKLVAVALISLSPSMGFADWSGGYAGLAIGQLIEGEGRATFEGEEQTATIEGDAIFGGFAGYQIQHGDFVFGGEVELSSANDFEILQDGDAVTRDFRLLDIKARAGFNTGDALIYGVLGLSQVKALDDFEGEDTAEGFNFGIGVDYQIDDQFVVGAEYLARRVTLEDEIDTDFDVDTLALRASFKF